MEEPKTISYTHKMYEFYKNKVYSIIFSLYFVLYIYCTLTEFELKHYNNIKIPIDVHNIIRV